MALESNEQRMTIDLASGEIMLDPDELRKLIDEGWNLYSTDTSDNSFLGDSDDRKRFVFIRRVRTS